MATEHLVNALPAERVSGNESAADVAERLREFQFTEPRFPSELIDLVVRGAAGSHVQPAHPRYFGLFNPAPSTMGVVGDALAAALNPNLAVWSHSPFAVELENHVMRHIATRFGFGANDVEGHFTTGGAESNLTAILAALTFTYPAITRDGVRSVSGQPTLYCSRGSHHSLEKAAAAAGLGSNAVRRIEVTASGAMDSRALERVIDADRQGGRFPFLVISTVGTTGTGAIDDTSQLKILANHEGLWLHVDAAWGGLASFVPELVDVIRGVCTADSMTFDAHKSLSVPMGASLFITTHKGLLRKTFGVSTDYMPSPDGRNVDLYADSMQWSRRFMGLKVFLTLAAAGDRGYEEVLKRQVALAHVLRDRLCRNGWSIENCTPLPVVCFAQASLDDQSEVKKHAVFVARHVVESGEAWISTAILPSSNIALRACISNYRTTRKDIDALIRALDRARQAYIVRENGSRVDSPPTTASC